MIAERQYTNFSASLNPFNSIPHVQPAATQTVLPAISVSGSLIPVETTPVVFPLPTNTYNGISPSGAAELSSLFEGYPPAAYTETDFDPPRMTVTSSSGVFTGIFGSPSMAFGSSFVQSAQPTVTVISVIPGPSISVTVSVRQSDLARASARPSVSKSVNLVTTSTSFTTISPSSSTTSQSSSSSSSAIPSSSSITSVPAARATSTSSEVSKQTKPSLSSAAIAGITFASAAAITILAFLLFLCLRRRRTRKPPSIYPEEAYLYDPPITPPPGLPPYIQATQPWMRGNTAYHPTTQLPFGIAQSPPMGPNSPPTRAVTPEGYERVGLLGIPEEEQDLAMMGSWPLRGRNSVSYRPLGTGRGYRLPPVHEDLQESNDNDPRNPFRDEHVS